MPAPLSTPSDARQLLGLAIKAVRLAAGVTQEAAAAAMRVETQTWRRYEWGHRDISIEKLERIAAALGATREDIERERAVIQGAPRTAPMIGGGAQERDFHFEVPIGGRARAGDRAPMIYDAAEQLDTLDLSWLGGHDAGYLRVAGESETGYVESGQLVIYRRNVWPRRDDGCVIETHSGEMYVKEYVRTEGDSIFVRQRFPERELKFSRAEVKGCYKIILRGG